MTINRLSVISRIFAERASHFFVQISNKPTPAIAVGGRVWHFPATNSVFKEPVNLQIITLPYGKHVTVFSVEERFTFPERPEIKYGQRLYETHSIHQKDGSFRMCITESFREALFYMKQYDRLMEIKGARAVMGSNQNIQPNLRQTINEYTHQGEAATELQWPPDMALIGSLQGALLKMADGLPQSGTRLNDLNAVDSTAPSAKR